jgi:hypothetical protein
VAPAELVPDPDKALPKELSQKSLGQAPPTDPAEVVRPIVRVIPAKIVEFSV